MDLELVIKIPEEKYNYIKKQVAEGIDNPLKICIANGMPLPEGAEILTKEAYSDLCMRAAGYEGDKEQESKTGHWRHYEGMLICSECGTEFYDDIMEYCGDDAPKWCPDCGTKMVDPQESEG